MKPRACCPVLLLCALHLPAQTHAADVSRPAEATLPAPIPGKPYALHVVVTDNKGKPVSNLPLSAFNLLVNGLPLPLQSGVSDSVPGRMLLVIDAVNTTYSNIAFERQQIGKYLTEGSGTLVQPTAVVVVTDTALEATPGYTTDGKALNDALEQKTIGLRDLRRSAGFYGAEERLDISLRALRRVLAAAAATPGHKSILWISPGWPLLSGPNIQLSGRDKLRIYQQVVDLSNSLHAADVTLYSLNPLGTQEDVGRAFYYREFVQGVRKPSQAQLGDLGVQVLAEQSGGVVFNGNNSLTQLIEESVADAAGTYSLTFVPPPAEPGNPYQQIEIRLSDPRLKARTTHGIYVTAP